MKPPKLDAVAWKLNTHPHKSLGWKCAAELFIPDSFDFFSIIINSLHFELETALGSFIWSQFVFLTRLPLSGNIFGQ